MFQSSFPKKEQCNDLSFRGRHHFKTDRSTQDWAIHFFKARHFSGCDLPPALADQAGRVLEDFAFEAKGYGQMTNNCSDLVVKLVKSSYPWVGCHTYSYTVCGYQWEFQDPKLEVLYHIRPFFWGIFPYIGLI